MEDAGGQFGSMPEANPTTEATVMMSFKVKRPLARSKVTWRMLLRGAARFGGRNNLISSTLSPAKKMPAISYPAVFPLL
jgi:hypothetical protein